MEIVEKGRVVGIDDLKFRKADNGKYSFSVDDDDDSYTTSFIFDGYKVMTRYQLRTECKDNNGTKKYGLIVTCGHNLALPCVFDKIKAYADDELLASIGYIQYIINRFGSVVRKEIYDIKNGK